MSFKQKYEVKKDYLPAGTNRRSGIKISKVKFIVLHDVGNDGYNKNTGRKNGTTARNNISYYRNSPTVSASAHTFIDDQEIVECIPAITGTPEKAWHVIYNKPKDNELFGADSNDAAIGVELCYYPEDKSRSIASYEKYIWYCAYLAYYFKLDPNKCFVGHETLDPGRKVDPTNGLKYIGKTTAQCIQDIISEYNECTEKATAGAASTNKTTSPAAASNHIGTATILSDTLNVRKEDNVNSAVVSVLKKDGNYRVYKVGNWGYNVGSGWISKGAAYTKYTPLQKDSSIGTVTTLVDDLNVRKEDDYSSPAVSKLPKGKSYKVYKVGKWGYNVGSGWISKGAAYTSFKPN